MNRMRLSELKNVAQNELRFRGQIAGWKSLQTSYRQYELSDKEAKIVAYLVQQAEVTLPEVPISLMFDD